jgi:hypothetical protein
VSNRTCTSGLRATERSTDPKNSSTSAAVWHSRHGVTTSLVVMFIANKSTVPLRRCCGRSCSPGPDAGAATRGFGRGPGPKLSPHVDGKHDCLGRRLEVKSGDAVDLDLKVRVTALFQILPSQHPGRLGRRGVIGNRWTGTNQASCESRSGPGPDAMTPDTARAAGGVGSAPAPSSVIPPACG